jgi:hypothetical protein
VSVGPIVAIGVGSGDVGRVGVATGDTSAPVCDVLYRGVSGLQPINVNNIRNANSEAVNHFAGTVMFHLLLNNNL